MSDVRNLSVAITGIGIICPLGVDKHACWDNMLQGKSGIRRITKFDTSDCLTKIGGEIPDEYFKLENDVIPKRLRKQTTLCSRLSLLGAKQAIEDSKIEIEDVDVRRCAVITGSGGKSELSEEGDERFRAVKEMINALPAWISIEYGFKGPSFNIATACASGGYAVGAGFDYIKSGKGDLCIAVGADTMLTKESIDGFNNLMALSEENDNPEKASKPFDRRRNGFVLSEGGCAIVLEAHQNAIKRNARIYAVISGYAITSEAFNIFAPEPTGKEMARTMNLAIQSSGIPKEKIGYVNAHGTSTYHNDLCETMAIKSVFGEHAYKLTVSSQKSMVGHTIGCAGALECAVTALSLYHQVITPTINYEEPDPKCDLDYVPNKARTVNGLEAAITNSFGFGGHNCSLVLEACV